MLIRSQNKRRLTNLQQVTDIEIYEQRGEFNVGAYYPFSVEDEYSQACIGTYSTETKAIKVLDDISEEYLYCERCRARGEEAGIIPCYVFQMPQDEEVEV